MTLAEYAQRVASRPCVGCNIPLPPAVKVERYNHIGGWEIEGFAVRQWLYVVCPKCEYQNALWKLGIGGDLNPAHQEIAIIRGAIYRHLWN